MFLSDIIFYISIPYTVFIAIWYLIAIWKKKDINVAARLKAGFSCKELKILNEKVSC